MVTDMFSALEFERLTLPVNQRRVLCPDEQTDVDQPLPQNYGATMSELRLAKMKTTIVKTQVLIIRQHVILMAQLGN